MRNSPRILRDKSKFSLIDNIENITIVIGVLSAAAILLFLCGIPTAIILVGYWATH